MIKVGITGGIGSGKSIICRIFSILGIPVYHADMEAKILVNNDPQIRNQLISLAGEKVFTTEGLNRPYLSDLIFNDQKLLQKVNGIIHPRVEAAFAEWTEQQFASPYIIQESAILIESGLYKKFDTIIKVTAPEDIRFRRVLPRENMTPERVRNIMKSQKTNQEDSGIADFIIVNDDITPVIPQVLKLHGILLKKNEFKG